MSNPAYGTPLLVGPGDATDVLQRVTLSSSDPDYSEAYVQNLIFKFPSCLPVNEIDRDYEGLIPICCELNTRAGSLDVLFVTPKGKVCIVEAKLWRNPEARRKVIGQILDYAKELSRWNYEDLQREVSRVTGRKGNALYELVKAVHPDTDESEFVDSVAKSLATGRFLLLIVGDGIRENAGAIAEFIERAGNLQFTFGLVELALYRGQEGRTLVQPRVLAKTIVVKRTIISVRDGQVEVEEGPVGDEGDDAAPLQWTERQRFYHEFWSELVSKLVLDDQSQENPNATKTENLFFSMPPSGSQAWVSAFFAKSQSRVGVYLRFAKGSFGDLAYQALLDDRPVIEGELSLPVEWESKEGRHSIIVRRGFENPLAPECREQIMAFFLDAINRFVNVFRSRLERISEDMPSN